MKFRRVLLTVLFALLTSIVSDARLKAQATPPISEQSKTLQSLYEEDENHRGSPSEDIRREDAVRKLQYGSC